MKNTQHKTLWLYKNILKKRDFLCFHKDLNKFVVCSHKCYFCYCPTDKRALITAISVLSLFGMILCGRYEVVKLSYSELKSATDGFDERRLLGAGAFGKVYRASLPSIGAVAIKQIHVNGTVGDPVGQFHNEVKHSLEFPSFFFFT